MLYITSEHTTREEEHLSEQTEQPPRPGDTDRNAWQAYWAAAGQPWRTVPEIDQARKATLARVRAGGTSVKHNRYLFKDVTLSRADVEWLLATHEDGRGPVRWEDEAERSREGLDLRGADLRGASLRGLPLARLRGGLPGALPEQSAAAAVHLEGADLRGAHLEGAELTGAFLQGADLRTLKGLGMTLAEAHLEGADLRQADLRQANLRAVHLGKAILDGARLQEARLNEAHLVRARLRDANLAGASLHKTQLEHADLHHAHLEAAELREVLAARANFYGAHLEGATLFGAHLEEAIFSGARLDGADLRRARLSEANLEAVHLHGAALRGTHLEGTNLFAARLEGVRVPDELVARVRELRSWREFSAALPPADLRGAFFDSGTNLRNIVLGDEASGYTPTADLGWGGANLAVVPWRTGKQQRHVLTLGDEQEARRTRDQDGNLKGNGALEVALEAAVRANRQLAVALQEQGLDEVAATFSYRAQLLRRRLFWRERSGGRWLFSVLLAALGGYGYRMWRILIAYVLCISAAALAYFVLGQEGYGQALPLHQAFLVSITAFHGRVFAEQFRPDTPQAWVTAFESIAGLVVEGVFIAMLAQRFFGK
jgi:uncharacterized protein YjbI with pentapeptide repeats